MSDEYGDEDYTFQADDAEMIHDFIVKEWGCTEIPLSDIGVYFEEDGVDPSQFDFRQNEKFIRIYADEILPSPRGISYDSESQTRYLAVIVKCIKRTDMILICDELRRIFARHRMCPGNAWDQLNMMSYVPLYPSYNFHHSTITIRLRNFCKWIPPMKLTYPV